MKLLKSQEVATKLGITRDHFRKEVKHQPDFPHPVKLTPKAHPKWAEEVIDNYLKQKAA